MKALALGGILLALVALAPLAVGGEECNPYPIGRCGNFNREAVVFCYYGTGPNMVQATDPNAIPITVDAGEVGGPQEQLGWLRPTPAEAFVNDPFNAPLPKYVVYQETNNVAGLQTSKFQCANFIWYPECHPPQWMGPYGIIKFEADKALA